MFGSTRRKATAAATQATLPIIKTLEIRGPLPDQFWSDPYALGYIYWTIAFFAKASTNGKVAGEDMGRCLFDTMTAISGRDGLAISQLATNLMSERNPEFLSGIRIAEMGIAIAYGSTEFDSEPEVIAATRMADAIGNSLDFMGSTTRASKISASLGLVEFNQKITSKFGLGL